MKINMTCFFASWWLKDMYHRWPQIYHRLESQRSNEIRWGRGRNTSMISWWYLQDSRFFFVVLWLELQIHERERETFLNWIWYMFPKCLIANCSLVVQFDGLLARHIFSWKRPEEKGHQYWKPQVFQHFNHQLELTNETSNNHQLALFYI